MTLYRKLIEALLAALMLSTLLTGALAETPADYDASQPGSLTEDQLYAESALLVDMDTGDVLLSKNTRVRMYPASTTKIMTLLLAVESDIPLEQQVTIPAEAGNVPEGSSVIGIKPGDIMTWQDLLYGFMLKSGNDGSNAIAVLASGSIDAFVDRMNQRAAELGCEGTHYTNAHGYHDQDHYSTAQDLARISEYAMRNEVFRRIVGAARQEITITRGGKTASGDAVNRNSLLLPESEYYYEGATGIKTGHHRKAGWCVVASAEKNGVNLMAVVLNCDTEDHKWQDAHKLLDYGFSRYESLKIETLVESVWQETGIVAVENAADSDPGGGQLQLNHGAITNGDAAVMVLRDSEAAMQRARQRLRETMDIEWSREPVAPVTAGEVLGRVRFRGPGDTDVTAELVASRDVEAMPDPTPGQTAEPVTGDSGALPAGMETHADADGRNGGFMRGIGRALVCAAILVSLLALGGALVSSAIRRKKRRRAAARRRAAMRRRGVAPRATRASGKRIAQQYRQSWK